MNQPPPPAGPPPSHPPGGQPFPPAAAPPPTPPSSGARPRRIGALGVGLISAGATVLVYVVAMAAVGVLLSISDPGDTEIAEGPHAPPEEPCAGATLGQLDDLSAELPTSTSATDDSSAECSWFATFSDGTRGGLMLAYSVHEEGEKGIEGASAAEAARNAFEGEKDTYTKGRPMDDLGQQVEVEDHHGLELGEDSFLSTASETSDSSGDPITSMRVVVLHDNMTVRVQIGEFGGEEKVNDTDPDYSDHEDLLIEIAAQALGNLG